MLFCLLALAFADPSGGADEEIVVLAPDRSVDSAASVTVIEVGPDLGASSDVASAIDAAPGTVVRRLGGLGDFASVSIRGSSARQVEVYLDGIALNPEGGAAVNLAELPLRAFERIEVFRGGAPPELGSAAMGGVVNLVTGDPVGTEGALSAGTLAAVRGHLSSTAPIPTGDVFVVADAFSTDGRFTYLDDRSTPFVTRDDQRATRDNNDRRQGALHLRLRAGPWTVLNAGLARETGVPGFTWALFEQTRYRVFRDLQAIRWEGAGTNWSSAAQVWGLIRSEQLEDPLGETAFVPRTDRYLTLSGGVRTHLRWAAGQGLALVGVIEGRSSGLRRSSGPSVTGADFGRTVADAASRRALELSAGAAIRDPREVVALTPVVQLTSLTDAVDGQTSGLWYAAPRTGVLVHLSDVLALAANGGRYLRAPDLVERFGDQGAIVGNPELRAERGTSADLALRWTEGEARAEAVGFLTVSTDRITWLQNAQGVARPVNLDGAQIGGFELSGAGTLDPVELSGSFTRTLSRQVSAEPAYSGQPVPGVPDWEWHHRLSVGGGAARAGLTLDVAAGTPLDPAGVHQTAARWIHGAVASVTDEALTVELEILNLLDHRTEARPADPLVQGGILSPRPVTDFFGYPLPGRTLMLTLRIAP